MLVIQPLRRQAVDPDVAERRDDATLDLAAVPVDGGRLAVWLDVVEPSVEERAIATPLRLPTESCCGSVTILARGVLASRLVRWKVRATWTGLPSELRL